MVSKRISRIRIIEIDELPIRRFWSIGVVQLDGIAPDGEKILIVAFLQGRRELVESDTEVDRGLVDAGDGDRPTLPCLGRVNHAHRILPLTATRSPRDILNDRTTVVGLLPSARAAKPIANRCATNAD